MWTTLQTRSHEQSHEREKRSRLETFYFYPLPSLNANFLRDDLLLSFAFCYGSLQIATNAKSIYQNLWRCFNVYAKIINPLETGITCWAIDSRANRWAFSLAVRLGLGPITSHIQKAAPFSRKPDATDLYQLPLRNPRLGSDAALPYFPPSPPPTPLLPPSLPCSSAPLRPLASHSLAEPKSPRPPLRFPRRRSCRDPRGSTSRRLLLLAAKGVSPWFSRSGGGEIRRERSDPAACFELQVRWA